MASSNAESQRPGDDAERPCAAPDDKSAAKLTKLERDHPKLYAARHVAIALIQLLIGLLGIGAFFRALLPRLDIDIGFPELPVPGWLRTVFGWYNAVTAVPVGWIRSMLRWVESSAPIPDWAWTIVQSAKWWGPLLIALFVAINEVERKRRRDRVESPDDAAAPQG